MRICVVVRLPQWQKTVGPVILVAAETFSVYSLDVSLFLFIEPVSEYLTIQLYLALSQCFAPSGSHIGGQLLSVQ